MGRSEIRAPQGSDTGQAIADLYRLRREAMGRLAFVLTRDAEVADEIVHDAFVKMYVRWATIEHPVAYLRQAVVNGCYSLYRRRRVAAAVPPDLMMPSELVGAELSDALAKLPFDQRVVLALRYFADLDDAEIAEALGIGRSTVRTRVHRALTQLRKEIERRGRQISKPSCAITIASSPTSTGRACPHRCLLKLQRSKDHQIWSG